METTRPRIGRRRALDGRADGRPSTVGLRESGRELALDNQALATSAGRGTRFYRGGHHHQHHHRHHYLLDPRTGGSRNAYRSVTVTAPRAMTADALSTALFLVPRPRAARLLHAAGPTEAWLTGAEGASERLAG